jgi:hypothetical protein
MYHRHKLLDLFDQISYTQEYEEVQTISKEGLSQKRKILTELILWPDLLWCQFMWMK